MFNDPIARPNSDAEPTWRTVVEFALPAVTDRASQAAQQVIAAVREFQLSSARLEQLEEAIAEAVHHAVPQNDRLQLELPIQIRVSVAALAGGDVVCCWGFFVIAQTADRLSVTDGPAHHTIELFLYQESAQPRQTAA